MSDKSVKDAEVGEEPFVKGICGGMSRVEPATENVQKLVDQLADGIRSEAGCKSGAKLKAISFKKQLVCGTNYFVKVHTGNEGDAHVHVRIFQPLPCHGTKLELHGVVPNKSCKDWIEYF